ncbi:DUF3077 domain-containing protein [Pseudomonas sp.]|uniref:DUF6124 family protein n=1 Tax=Pseudomonas sp. TaxID=306 RepID=UPI0032650F19
MDTTDHDSDPELCPRKLFHVGTDVSTEEALTNASEILSSALQTAYQSAENPDSTQSLVIMGIAQLIETAQALVDAVLERDFPTDPPGA